MNRAVRCGIACSILAVLVYSAPAVGSTPRLDLERAIEAKGLDPASLTLPETLNDEIVTWAGERLDTAAPPNRLLEDLLDLLSSPEGLGLSYDPSSTATAEEVFSSRRANCLAFTHLFVGLSRYFGLETYYLDFDQSEKFRREENLIVVSGHVTAGFGEGSGRKVLEFGAVEGGNSRSARRISDLAALALFYSNRSAEALRAGDVATAVDLAGIAVRLQPELANAWVNLGVSKRRSNDLRGAEEAYREAIRIDPDHLPAYHNLTTLFWLEGDRHASKEIMKLLDRGDNMNPYTFIEIGDLNLAGQRLDEARRFYRRARWLDDSLGEPKAALGIVALEAGRQEKARTWLRRARKSDPEGRRTLELAERLAEPERASDGA